MRVCAYTDICIPKLQGRQPHTKQIIYTKTKTLSTKTH